ncbi:MAG: aminotransferase class I/II-fold pyridoxal phosphate-dependent enzyme [Bacteroidales bacterium]
MIQPAQRLSAVKEYYFSDKLREIEKLRASGINVLNLGIGNPDQPPSQQTLDVLMTASQNKNNHGYPSYNGHKSLREAFAKWYQNYFKVELNPENEVLPLIGSKEGIMHISMAFLNPGDGVLIPNPSYPAYRSVANLVGARILDFDLTEENDWFPDFDQIEKMDLTGVKMMWVNYPNMPTGKLVGKNEFQKLVDFGLKYNILICNDNPYSFILNKQYFSIFQADRAKETALELNSMSKSHNMAGWRIGVLVGNPILVKYVLTVKSNMDSGMFVPLQLAAAEALGCSDAWYDQINMHYEKRRAIAHKILDAIGCTYTADQAGMFVWAKIPVRYKDSFEITDILLEKSGVFITPGQIFGSNGNRYIRISLASKENDLLEALERVNKKL